MGTERVNHKSKPRHIRQVRVGQHKKTFYDMKIRRSGRKKLTRYLAVGKIIPQDWLFVRIHKPEIQDRTATIKIECLLKTTEVKE